jgi:hypothetical protein
VIAAPRAHEWAAVDVRLTSMRSLVIVAVVALPSVASADKCLDSSPAYIRGDAGRVVLCASSGSTCSVVANATAPVTTVPARPSADLTKGPILKDAHDKLVACVDATCKPVGPKLAAAQAKAREQSQVTTDVGVAVVDYVAWNIATDAPIAIAKPPKPPMNEPVAYAVGKIIVATWRNCADDLNCNDPIATIVDATGKQIGKPFPDGRLVIVDAHHAAMIGDGHKLTSFDTDTGAQLGTIALIPNVALIGLTVGKVDDGSIGVSWQPASAASFSIALVKVPAAKPPSVAWTRKLAMCGP